ncbi:MAG: hypothetical protein PHD76_01655 [Methylacidiphilales bacterium]|nr:hypothetical protein [Candidatus Methylacidiphilales bacterium]
MKPKYHLFFAAFLCLCSGFAATSLRGADASAASGNEARLREALRAATLQVRDVQNQVVTLQAAQAQIEQDKAGLKTQVDGLNKQIDQLVSDGKAARETSEKAIAALNSKADGQDKQIGKYKEVLEKWKSAYNEAVTLAKAREMERAKLEMDNAVLQRQVVAAETRNAELFKTGSEILTRYEKFSLGDALSAKEPFVGTMQVKLQNLVQGYEDKLVAQRITDSDQKNTETK